MRLYSRVIAFVLALVLICPFPVLAEEKKFIRWVDFNVPLDVLEAALKLDTSTVCTETHLGWVETLAYLAAKYGGEFTHYKKKDLDNFTAARKSGETLEALTGKMKHFLYYLEAYHAILDGLVGYYRIQTLENGQVVWKERYGLKAFSPIAKGYPFQHYDDFGTGRDYGYKRRHLGHDMMAQVGTPVIAVESGVVTAMGWNQYGGWRIGLQSADGKRYYYYAHLRKDRPYAEGLEEGMSVKAGDVIGYVGRSGYSQTENKNNIKQPHLHFGLQIIFDESQRTGPTEIWIDTYALIRLLQKNKCETNRNEETREHTRKYDFESIEKPADGSEQPPAGFILPLTLA